MKCLTAKEYILLKAYKAIRELSDVYSTKSLIQQTIMEVIRRLNVLTNYYL